MIDFSSVMAHVADQDRGSWFDLRDPVTGGATGMRLLVAGPDSQVQHRAALDLADELADLADFDGRVLAHHREAASLRALAKAILGWEIVEDGQPIPFSTDAVVRVLRSARWLRNQADEFAARRRPVVPVQQGE